jgi:hypothetical protein
MKDNIVGAVIMISLIFWIPISCAICYYDKKLKKDIKRRSISSYSDRTKLRPNRRTFSRRLNRQSACYRDGYSDGLDNTTQQRPTVFYPPNYSQT